MKKLTLVIAVFITIFNLMNGQTPSWKLVDKDWIFPNGVAHYQFLYQDIKCYDSLHCIAIGNMSLQEPWNRVTTDGGKTWFTTLKDTIAYYYDSSGLHATYFPAQAKYIVYKNPGLCIIVGDSGYYYRSTDNCLTWTKSKVPKRCLGPRVDMFDTKIGAMYSGIIYLTYDGGITWSAPNLNLPDSLTPLGYDDISVPEPGRIIVLAYRRDNNSYIYEYLIESRDSGKTWSYLSDLKKKRFDMIYFLNTNIGWATGGNLQMSSDFTTTILKTEDGGKTWITQLDTFARPYTLLSSVSFADSLNGIAVGDFFNLWKTSDGGQHWIQDTTFWKDSTFINSDSIFINADLTCIAYPVKDKILAADIDGKIFEYSDEIVGVEENWMNYTELKEGTSLVYPNPSKGEIIIKYNSMNTGNLKLEIYDNLGNSIYSKLFKKENNEISVPVSLKEIGDGVFYYKIKNDNKILNYGKFTIIR